MSMKKRTLTILIAALMTLCMMPETALAQASPTPARDIPVAKTSEAADALLDPLCQEEGEQVLPVTIDPADGTAVVSGTGEEAALEDVYDLTPAETKALTAGSEEANKEAILDYLLRDPCIVREKEDGTLLAGYPFGMKTLFLLAEEGQLKDTCGAAAVEYEKDWDRYALMLELEKCLGLR